MLDSFEENLDIENNKFDAHAHLKSAYFAERDRSFRRIVTVAQREVLRA